MKKVLQKIVLGYIIFTLLIATLFYITNKIKPHKILKESSTCIKGLPPINVIDMDRPYNTLYILDDTHKIYKIDPYKKKLLATYQLENIGNLQGLSVQDDGYHHTLYVSDQANVYRAKVTKHHQSSSIKTEKVLSNLQNPQDIHVYFEYRYTPQEQKRIETLAVLEGDIGKVNIYDIATENIIESKKAKLDILEHRTLITSIAMKNIPYYVRKWDNELGIKTRHFLNKIRLYTQKSSFSTQLGKIAYSRLHNYIIPDQENNYLWVYNTFGLYDWDYIKLDKSPYMAYTFPRIEPDIIIEDAIKGKGDYIVYLQYTDGNGLICADVTNSFYGSVKAIIDWLFKIFVAPFFFFGLMFVGKVG